MFDAFSQAESSLDRSRGGLGLGLTLVKGLIELHGGKVQAASAGLGRGTTITFALPLAEQGSTSEPAGAVASAPPSSHRILIIEDNADAAKSLQILLNMTGHHVAVASKGSTGLELAATFCPNVVLCDLGLPGGMDGFRCRESISSRPQLCVHIPHRHNRLRPNGGQSSLQRSGVRSSHGETTGIRIVASTSQFAHPSSVAGSAFGVRWSNLRPLKGQGGRWSLWPNSVGQNQLFATPEPRFARWAAHVGDPDVLQCAENGFDFFGIDGTSSDEPSRKVRLTPHEMTFMRVLLRLNLLPPDRQQKMIRRKSL